MVGRDPRPKFVVIVTPSQSSDAWVAATLNPPYANLSDIECDKAVENEFARRETLETARWPGQEAGDGLCSDRR